jgi:hypothetical protein
LIQPQSQDDHRRALADVLAAFRTLTAEQWRSPREPGKWSPAQIAEHLRLTYEVTTSELAGGQGMRLRAPWFVRPLLRLRFQGKILRNGQFPEGAPAVREIRPPDAARPREEALADLESAAERFMTAGAEADRNGRVRKVTHPFFGRFDLDTGLRLGTAHVRHHEAQVLEVIEAAAIAAQVGPARKRVAAVDAESLESTT